MKRDRTFQATFASGKTIFFSLAQNKYLLTSILSEKMFSEKRLGNIQIMSCNVKLYQDILEVLESSKLFWVTQPTAGCEMYTGKGIMYTVLGKVSF